MIFVVRQIGASFTLSLGTEIEGRTAVFSHGKQGTGVFGPQLTWNPFLAHALLAQADSVGFSHRVSRGQSSSHRQSAPTTVSRFPRYRPPRKRKRETAPRPDAAPLVTDPCWSKQKAINPRGSGGLVPQCHAPQPGPEGSHTILHQIARKGRHQIPRSRSSCGLS